MKKVVVFSFPHGSHVLPHVIFCEKLIKEDVQIIYYGLEKFFYLFGDIQGAKNLELRKYPKLAEEKYTKVITEGHKNYAKNYSLIAVLELIYSLTDLLIDFSVNEINSEQPDLIISDAFAMWGRIGAQVSEKSIVNYYIINILDFKRSISKDFRLAFAVSKSVFTGLDKVARIFAVKKKIDKKYQIKTMNPLEFMDPQDKFSIVMTSRQFQPYSELYGENVRFLGPANIEYGNDDVKKDIIFISLGTGIISETFWDDCIEALGKLGFSIVISFGGNSLNKVNSKYLVDKNITIHNNLPINEYRDMIKRAVLFISHGGFNSINDAILFRTPLLIFPFTEEQYMNGSIIQDNLCGLLYRDKTMKINTLRKFAIKAIYSNEIQNGLINNRESFMNSVGYSGVIQEILNTFNLKTQIENSEEECYSQN